VKLPRYIDGAAVYPGAGGVVTVTKHRVAGGTCLTIDHFYGDGGWQSHPIRNEREARMAGRMLAEICGARFQPLRR
jgi:hypothetical protein